MIVASTDSHQLLFFNRSSASSHNYNYIGFRNVNYQNPHGLSFVNDTFFYAISYVTRDVYTYSNAGNMTVWTQTLVLNTSSVTGSNNGNHVSGDDCGRYWLSLGAQGTRIFDGQLSPFSSTYLTGFNIYDTLILDNYVVYLSDRSSNRIVRVDPQIQC